MSLEDAKSEGVLFERNRKVLDAKAMQEMLDSHFEEVAKHTEALLLANDTQNQETLAKYENLFNSFFERQRAADPPYVDLKRLREWARKNKKPKKGISSVWGITFIYPNALTHKDGVTLFAARHKNRETLSYEDAPALHFTLMTFVKRLGSDMDHPASPNCILMLDTSRGINYRVYHNDRALGGY